jgi:hypothetical protein
LEEGLIDRHEDEIDTEISFVLSRIDVDIVELVKSLCRPLFAIFDFAEISDGVYKEIVTQFVAGKIS